MKKSRSLTLYYIGIAAALLLTLALIVLLMRVPLGELMVLAGLLGVTAVVSAIVGFISQRLGWWRRLRSLTITILLGYLLGSALTLLNVWLTAKWMFINAHDLQLAMLLLLFASGIAVAFGYFLSTSITTPLRKLVRGSQQLGQGDFTTRVDIPGNDEVAQVGAAFNNMVARLEQALEAERAVEFVRRDLIAWVSHDLRTPLASLRAMLDALADGVVSDPETVSNYLRQSQAEVARLSGLIDDLFELAQLDAGYLELHAEESSLTDLISDTLEAHNLLAQSKGVALSGSAAQEVDPVWMAADKVGRVLYNLVDNALRHTPSGGRVTLRAEAHNGNVLVTVADSGEGIPEEDLPHVFERFYRGEKSRSRAGFERGGGVGLGLAIAKGIVEAHNGQIWVESVHQQGTTFSFTLPKSEPRKLLLTNSGGRE